MTNINAHPGKLRRRRRLFDLGLVALKNEGWRIEKVQGAGKSSLRRIARGDESKLASIRTTQDTWIAFPRDRRDQGWVTLSDVDLVVAVSVDDSNEPRFAQVHLIDGDEMRDRFDRAYRARLEAGHSIPLGRGVWLALYLEEAQDPVNRVGAGAGLANPAILRAPLEGAEIEGDVAEVGAHEEPGSDGSDEERFTIAEAKRRLARTLGVDPSSVRITIEA